MLNVRKTFGYIVLVLCAISMILPFLWMISTSFMTNEEIFSYPIKFLPSQIDFLNYKNVFCSLPLVGYFLNSLIVSVVTTLGQIIVSTMAGYAFARFEFRGKEFLFIIILMTMMVPPQVNIIPLFYLMRELGWIDSYQALILPGFFGGFGVFLMRQWFTKFPKSLEEAAKIDGSNNFEIFIKVAVPLALPAIMTIAVFTFVTSWNSFMWPLIVTNSDSMRTLPVALAAFKGSYREIVVWGELMACSVISVIPVVLVFLLGKKYFINDILAGSIKD